MKSSRCKRGKKLQDHDGVQAGEMILQKKKTKRKTDPKFETRTGKGWMKNT